MRVNNNHDNNWLLLKKKKASAILDIFACFWIRCFSAILQKPTPRIFNFALAQKCVKSAKINVVQKFPLLQ